MPKYFGENNPDISDVILVDILRYADNRALILVLSRVSKDWRLIINSKEFHEDLLKVTLKKIVVLDYNNLEDKFEKISSGYTNTNYKVHKSEGGYVVRLPLMKDHVLIKAHEERDNSKVAFELGLGAEVMSYEYSTRVMVTKYINHKNCLTKSHLTEKKLLAIIAEKLNTLHKALDKFQGDWIIFNKIRVLYGFIVENKLFLDRKTLDQLMSMTDRVKHSFDQFKINLCPCHNDLSPNNFLYMDDDVKIIDWEFSGNNDPAWDLAFLCTLSDLPPKDESFLLETYFGEKPSEADYNRCLLYKPIVHFWVGLLSLLQIYNCNQRLGKNWLAQIADGKFNKSKALFESLTELIEKLEQKQYEVATSNALLFGMQKIHAERQGSASQFETEQSELYLSQDGCKKNSTLNFNLS